MKLKFLLFTIFTLFPLLKVEAHKSVRYGHPVYQGVDPDDQKFLDHAPQSVYLYPQAFANNSDEIKAIKLRVCVDWKEASQAKIVPHFDAYADGHYGDHQYKWIRVPYRSSQIPDGEYEKLASPAFCREFKTVVIPTSETVLAAIRGNVGLSEQSLYTNLNDVDMDLDRRFKALFMKDSLQIMREEMEAEIREKILKSQFMRELKQEIYQDVLNELKANQSINDGGIL